MQHSRRPVAERPDEQSVSDKGEGQADDETAGQETLFVESDEDVMGHAVDKTERDRPNQQL